MESGDAAVTRKGYERSVGSSLSPLARRSGPARGRATRSLLRLFDRALGQHPREVLLVLGAGAQVAGRAQAVGRMQGRLFGLRAVVQGFLDGRGTDRGRTHVGQADAP